MKEEVIRLLVVDGTPGDCDQLALLIKNEGMTHSVAHNAKTALDRIRLTSPDLLVTDFRLPDLDGLELLQRAKQLDNNLPVIVITSHAEINGAIKAIKASAFHYMEKPLKGPDFIRVIREGVAERRLKLKQSSRTISATRHLVETMGPSDAVGELALLVNRVSKSNFSVIITGETGAGKEVVARAIHEASVRRNGPFIPIDCGAVPELMLEAELFGHEKGAFTGSIGLKRGKFELAHGGTLFLDEILNMPLSSQTKVLRAVQERAVSRIGATRPVQIDVRILTASNQDLTTAIAQGKFRPDLFYRLNEFGIAIPPLRERNEDILYLANRFLDQANNELNKVARSFSESATNALLSYPWPGNVRQLRSTIRSAVLLTDDQITADQLDITNTEKGSSPYLTRRLEEIPTERFSLREIVAQCTNVAEREAILQALLRTLGNKAKAARTLKIDYKTMQTKLKKYGINLNQKAYEKDDQT
jgi:two-component system nitrogen regulation response regulator GlnG